MSESIVTDSQAQAALDFLASTDEMLGALSGQVESLYYRIKARKGIVKLESEHKTVSLKEAAADCDPEVLELYSERCDAVVEYETIRARRKRAELTIEVWRSVNANRRQGSV